MSTIDICNYPESIVIESLFMPTTSFFALYLQVNQVIIDDISLFEKQSYRNRARIASANKILDLIIPVRKGKTHLPLREVEIDYSFPWQRKHWTSITSAYKKSPYFDYFSDEFKDIYCQDEKYLLNYCINLNQFLLRLLDLNNKFIFHSHLSDLPSGYMDMRNYFHPKKVRDEDLSFFKPIPYYQVFSDRRDFIPNLSIIDLIFNMGNESVDVLHRMIKLSEE